MRHLFRNVSTTMLAGMVLTAALSAQVLVSTDIAVSTTWTKNNVYKLETQIYVLPGATLTIEAGTVVSSTTNLGGSLAVTRGAQIFIQGTQAEPVIMTSDADVATWTGGNPKTGVWREAANEWGNLTIMGTAYISENIVAANTPAPNPANVATMEGLTAAFPGDPRVIYGGGDDYADSGSISYVSLRYTGKVIALNNELNGLSLGGIGRGTDINHVEIMNNVDDGIEVWGGTVNFKHISIWNIGDDSVDIDQGWRGKMQFILVVQGWSLNAAQGSGVGDNCFETDGAEDSHYQPVTTSTIYNCTVIGQPLDGDHGTAWRDNARVQYRNCIFMNVGERVVSFDNLDGDGAQGYGFGGTLSWPATWTTPFSVTSTVNPPVNPGAFYTVQTSGNLAEIKDSVFFQNPHASAYTEATARGVFAVANNNVQEPVNSPITSITRGATVVRGGKLMQQVLFLDPRPQNDALVSVASAPADGFFCSAAYRGAFAPGENWLADWTASQAFGFTAAPVPGPGQPGTLNAAAMDINGAVNANGTGVGSTNDPKGPFFTTVASGQPLTLSFDGQVNQPIILLSSLALNPGVQAFGGGIGQFDIGGPMIDPMTGVVTGLNLVATGTSFDFINSLFNTGPTGAMSLTFPGILPPGTVINFQSIIFNTSTIIRFSNAVQLTIN